MNRQIIKDEKTYNIKVDDVIKTVSLFKDILYPEKELKPSCLKRKIRKFRFLLNSILKRIDLNYTYITEKIICKIPYLMEMLDKDILSIYKGDPAAKTKFEIICCYPGFFAVLCYRFAHELYKMNVPIIPRIITEYCHSKTGIDIHPGAEIGECFCIDHGTGIVIGETTVIGNNVRIYHGVTLGTKGFKTDEEGFSVRNVKRHPNIGNNVIIYANATILGGDTFIGNNCIIGTGSIVKESVKENSIIKKCPLEGTEEY